VKPLGSGFNYINAQVRLKIFYCSKNRALKDGNGRPEVPKVPAYVSIAFRTNTLHFCILPSVVLVDGRHNLDQESCVCIGCYVALGGVMISAQAVHRHGVYSVDFHTNTS